MPLPDFTADGLLPPGVHSCTLDELERSCGRRGQRATLMSKLKDYADVLRSAWGGGLKIIVDGSFVSTAASPNDVDVVVLIHENPSAAAPLPHQATSVRRPWVNSKYSEQIDARGTSDAANAEYWINYFQQRKDGSDQRKGIVEVTL